MASKKAKILVVDSNAFIKAVRIEEIGSQFYTAPQVIEEIRDVKARQFLQTFPFEIKTKDPTPAALKAVADFARKTGDYAFLSAVDLRVLALVYTLENDTKGSVAHLRTQPLQSRAVADIGKKDEEEGDEDEGEGEDADEEDEGEEGEGEAKADAPQDNNISQQTTENGHPSIDTPSTPQNTQAIPTQSGENEGTTEEKEEDDGWITPLNIGKVRARRGKEADIQAEEVEVGCFTTDYAMQSVILQMGLKLLSIDGMVIKRIRQYVLKCTSCLRICKDTERKFCPHCGNLALVRFEANTDDEGNTTYRQAQRIQTRGTIFSMALPQGGRNSKDLILTEDTYKSKTKWKRDPKAADVFSEDYSFASKKVGPADRVVVGSGNRNPNIAKRRIGKKNKAISTL